MTVLDKPSSPQGPLEAVDTSPDAITVAWKPPKDNGGSRIQVVYAKYLDSLLVFDIFICWCFFLFYFATWRKMFEGKECKPCEMMENLI